MNPKVNGHQPTELWQGALTGMSQAEVQRRFPDAKPPTSPDQLKDGARELLALPATVAQHPAHAEFYFSRDSLEEVRLHFDDVSNIESVNMNSTKELAALLTRKYGAPIVCDWIGSLHMLYQCKWAASDLGVTLMYLNTMAVGSSLSIIYDAEMSSPEDNL